MPRTHHLFNRNHLLPVTLGIAIGTVQGCLHAGSILHDTQYIAHRLYATAAATLLGEVNHDVFRASIVCFVISLILAVRNKLSGRIRNVLYLPIIVGLVELLQVDVYSAFRMVAGPLIQFASELKAGVWKEMLANGLPQIAASGLIVIAGLFLLARMRKSPQETKSADTSSSALRMMSSLVSRFSSVLQYSQSIYKKHWGIDAIVFISFIALNVLPVFLGISNSVALHERPNVILIQVDTLRADHLGCYGYTRKTSPNIDAFANQGIQFKKVISGAPWTTPSVATYMTSRNLRVPLLSSMPLNAVSAMPLNAVMLSQALRDRGYSTIGITSNGLVNPAAGFSRGYDSYDERYTKSSSPEVVATALDRLRDVKNRKFFMFMLFMDPHSPYVLHDKHNFYPGYRGKLGKEIDITKYGKDMQPDDLKYAVSMYDSEIAYTDEHIGRLFDALKKMRLYDDTLIIFLSDHGEEFGEHGLMGHGKHLYDEALSVPLIIKLPGQRRGTVVEGTFPLLDLFPSIMDVLREDASSLGLQGVARHLQGLTQIRDTDVYSSTDFVGAKGECMHSKSYKIIESDGSPTPELYNLRSDPGERRNLASSEPVMTSTYSNWLKKKDKEIDASLVGDVHKYVSPDILDKQTKTLRSLGYLQ